MPAYDDDEDDKQQTNPAAGAPQTAAAPSGGRGPAPQFDFQRNFQRPMGPGSTSAGQASPMPWSQQAPGLAPGGATPWGQAMPPQGAPQGGPVPGAALAPGMTPNWQALAARFGGGGQVPSPAYQPQQGGGGPMGGGGQGGGPMQGIMQRAAAQIAQRRAMAQQFLQARQGQGAGPQQPMPQRPGFAMPQGGGPVQIPLGNRNIY